MRKYNQPERQFIRQIGSLVANVFALSYVRATVRSVMNQFNHSQTPVLAAFLGQKSVETPANKRLSKENP
jgi:hypothetical protein